MFDRRITELWKRPGEMAHLVNYRLMVCEPEKEQPEVLLQSEVCCTEQSVPLLSEYAFATHTVVLWSSGDCQRHFKSLTNPCVRRNILQSCFFFLYKGTKNTFKLTFLYLKC